MIRELNKKDKISFIDFCVNYRNSFEENFITINKERKFLNNYSIAEKVFDNIIRKGDKAFVLEEKSEIKAAIIIVGFSDSFPRKYVKILANENNHILWLMKYLNWHIYNEVFLKIKKLNKINRLLSYYDREKKIMKYKFNWEFLASRGNEVLLIKRATKLFSNNRNEK